MTREEINKSLKIVSLKSKRFKCLDGYYEYDRGHALYHDKLGYFSFGGDVPYTPSRKALQSILDAGGFTGFENAKWVWPI